MLRVTSNQESELWHRVPQATLITPCAEARALSIAPRSAITQLHYMSLLLQALLLYAHFDLLITVTGHQRVHPAMA